jgi:hypothetical protein
MHTPCEIRMRILSVVDEMFDVAVHSLEEEAPEVAYVVPLTDMICYVSVLVQSDGLFGLRKYSFESDESFDSLQRSLLAQQFVGALRILVVGIIVCRPFLYVLW